MEETNTPFTLWFFSLYVSSIDVHIRTDRLSHEPLLEARETFVEAVAPPADYRVVLQVHQRISLEGL